MPPGRYSAGRKASTWLFSDDPGGAARGRDAADFGLPFDPAVRPSTGGPFFFVVRLLRGRPPSPLMPRRSAALPLAPLSSLPQASKWSTQFYPQLQRFFTEMKKPSKSCLKTPQKRPPSRGTKFSPNSWDQQPYFVCRTSQKVRTTPNKNKGNYSNLRNRAAQQFPSDKFLDPPKILSHLYADLHSIERPPSPPHQSHLSAQHRCTKSFS